MNWHERINRARENGGFTPEDKALAENWVTCACGEQDMRIPRRTYTKKEYEKLPSFEYYRWDMKPEDARLARLGSNFDLWVSMNEFGKACCTLQLIEKRAAQILEDLEKEKENV